MRRYAGALRPTGLVREAEGHPAVKRLEAALLEDGILSSRSPSGTSTPSTGGCWRWVSASRSGRPTWAPW